MSIDVDVERSRSRSISLSLENVGRRSIAGMDVADVAITHAGMFDKYDMMSHDWWIIGGVDTRDASSDG